MNVRSTQTLPEKIVTFSLEDREYAVALDVVHEIIPMIEIVDMPELPDYFLGVINLRGVTIPIIDLKIKMGLEPTEISIYTPIVICKINNSFVGVLTEKLLEILTLDSPNVDQVNDSEQRETIIDSVISTGGRPVSFPQ